ncbi:MAG: hypothetical protein KKB50_05300 [Planctomycetes bacterium]|nr:hypothetical protein [Planctomycetota bacterium]
MSQPQRSPEARVDPEMTLVLGSDEFAEERQGFEPGEAADADRPAPEEDVLGLRGDTDLGLDADDGDPTDMDDEGDYDDYDYDDDDDDYDDDYDDD